tara:strand:- start:11494 stop:11982 length:489 start_codon:yes stop_codon:yes gene_type:complete
MFLISNLTFGQKLKKNEIDEFTKSHIQTTSWETLSKKHPLFSYARLRKIDSVYIFDVKLMGGNKVFSVDKGENLYIKLDDDEIIKIYNTEYELSNYGEGAVGILGSQSLGVYLKCSIRKEQLKKLREKKIIKIRLYSSNGYREADVKSKHAKKFIKMMNLIK